MVHDEVWRDAGMPAASAKAYLCVGCIERRLQRKLRPEDFIDCPLNDLSISDNYRFAWSFRTDKLIDRLIGARICQ